MTSKCQADERLPLAHLNKHLLDQMSDKYKHVAGVKPDEKTSSAEEGKTVDGKIPLNVTIGVSDLNSISPIDESFSMVFRMFVFFEVEDLDKYGLDKLAGKARMASDKYSCSRDEVDEFCTKYTVPEISIFNLVDGGKEGLADIRIYGGFKGKTLVMWNQGYRCKCREVFELQAFPFDSNELSLDLRLNDPTTWDLYELRVNMVQFHKIALQQTEYDVHIPVVQYGSPVHKCKTIQFQATRRPQYYIQNIVLMMFALSLLGLLTFVMDINDLGDRVGTVLTVILTAVAFKFIIDGALPKVPYNTVIDYYIVGSTLALAAMALLSVVPSLTYWGSEETQYRVNMIIGTFSLVFVVLLVIVWFAYAKYVCIEAARTQKVKTVDGKNWYAYRFSSPPFLSAIE